MVRRRPYPCLSLLKSIPDHKDAESRVQRDCRERAKVESVCFY